MPPHEKLKLRYNFNDIYPGTWQPQGVGAQAAPYKRGWYPQLPATDSAGAVALCRLKKYLYIGGEFQTLGGVALKGLGRVNLETGEVDSTFNAQLVSVGTVRVNDIATDGTHIYIAGAWDTVAGMARPYLAKLDTDGNLVQDFNATADNIVTRLEYRTGSATLYALGIFGAIGGEVRLKMAEISTQTGIATAFDAGAFGGSADPLDLAYSLTDDTVYVVGNFTSVNGGTARGYGAKLNGTTGVAVAWNPAANDYIKAIVVAYPLVYLGGVFTNVGGSARTNIGAVNQAATATSFAPTASDPVACIGLDSTNSRLYFGGDSGLAVACDLDGNTLPWTPGFDAADTLVAVLVYKSTTFWVGSISSFNGIGATTVTQDGAATVPFPLFRDDNTIFVKQTGAFEDAGAGTYAAPKRTINGAIGTTPTFADQSAAGNDLTQTGTVNRQKESFCEPVKAYWMAGLFNDSNYLNVPAAVGTAFAASNAFTVQLWFWLDSLAAVNTLWDWANATGDVRATVDTNGAVNFNIHGTTANSSNGVVGIRQWYCLTLEKNPSGNLKRAWLATPGQKPVLIINTIQAATLGANSSHRLAKHRSNANEFLVGVLGPVMMFDAAYVSALTSFDLPLTWRDAVSADCFGYWPMQTKSAAEGSTALRYVCILDSETYEEAFNWHVEGSSLYANDGCRPTIAPRIGAKPGTYGARVSGREKFSTGAGSTFLYVSKAGNDSTGTRGDQTLPFLTINAAISAASASDTIQIEDSGVYLENITCPTALIIQAAQGQVPTIKQALTSADLLGGQISFYGLILLSAPGAAGGIYAPTAGVSLYDCTLSDTSFTSGAFSNTLKNCQFKGHSEIINSGASVLTIENCAFFDTSDIGLSGSSNSLRMKLCTMDLSGGTGGLAGGFMIRCTGVMNAVIELCRFVPRKLKSVINANVSNTSSQSVALLRCVIDASNSTLATSGEAFAEAQFSFSSGSPSNNLTCFRNVFLTGSPQVLNGFQTDLQTSGGTPFNNFVLFSNCAAIGIADAGFDVETAVGVSVRLENCAAMNCETGFNIVGAGTLNARGLVEAGAETVGITSSGAQTPTYSTVSSVGGSIVSTGDGFEVGAAGFISTAAGAENIALSATSPGVFGGDAAAVTDQGANWAWVCSQSPGAVINGLVFSGTINQGAGLENLNGVATRAEFCTFDGLGIAGAIMRDGFDAYACEGAETNGPAFRIGGVSASVTYSIAWGCAGAAFVYGAPDYLDEHNSSWGCEYGHYDAAGAVGTINASVHISNGVDVASNADARYSVVGSLGADTEVDASTVRLDPLYRDPLTGDLRLVVPEAGFAFTSPAQGLAADGSDAGALEAEYGTLTRRFYEVSFADFVGWTNPDDIPEVLVPVKLAQGVKPTGKSFSSARAYKRQWALTWGPNNPMPVEQRIALTEFYQSAGSVAVAFDGCTFIMVTVQKSEEFRNDEVGGAYTSTDVDRPVGTIVVQED